MFRLTLVIIISYLSLQTLAQPGQIVFDHYSFAEGFVGREARSIASTKEGLIWVSSSNGLARFNGKQFKFYKHVEGDSNSLSHNYCSALQVDKRGNIWLVSNHELEVFDPTTEVFKHIKFYDDKKEPQSVYPNSFYYDSTTDMLWITTRSGLRYSKNGSYQLQTIESLTKDKAFANTDFGVMANEGTKYLWLNTWHKMIKLNLQSGSIEDSVIIPEMIDGIKNERGLLNLRSALVDNDKVLWLGTWLRGLIEYNTVTKTFHQYVYSDYKKSENTIFSIKETGLKEQTDLLWLATHTSGFSVFNKRSKKFTSFLSKYNNNLYGIAGTVFTLFVKPNDGLWIGAENGLHRYDFAKQLFHKIDLSSISAGTEMYPIENIAVEQNLEKKDKRMWFIIPYTRACIYDFETQKILPVPTKMTKYFAPDIGIWQLYIDSRNVLWLSTTQFGLIGYDIHKDQIICKERQFFYEPREWATSFFEDSKKQFWIGSLKGLFKMNEERNVLAPIKTVNDLLAKDELSLAVMDMTEDKNGNIWMITDLTDKKMASICRYEPKKNEPQIIYAEKRIASAINTPAVDFRDILITKKSDRVYVSNYGSGAFYCNIDSGQLQKNQLFPVQPITDSYTNDLTEDSIGNVWCGVDVGVACYKPADNTFVNYSYYQYGIGNNDKPSLYFSQQSGMVYLGESNAITFFDHKNALQNSLDQNLVFNEFQVFNKPVATIKNNLQNGDVIELDPDQNMISIAFALLSYNNANENTYSWMLKGLDKVWTTSKNNIATYTNLDAGTYTLLVKAANSNGEWTHTPLQLTIKIKQRFYKTWWFILLCLAGIGGLVYYYFQRRLNRIRDKYQLRNKIAMDLHDEIGSTLTSISILSSVSQKAMEQEPAQAKEMLQQITSQSKQIQQNMSDIVWSIRPDNEKLEDLVVRMREYAAQTLEPIMIDTNISANEELLNKILPMEHRKQILLIYKEAINNVVKHANATNVIVQLVSSDHHLELRIQDNGQWKGNGHNSGSGTKSMHQRAATINGKLNITPTDKGTTVILNLPIP